MSDRIPKAESLYPAGVQFNAMAPDGSRDGPSEIRAWWVLLNASWRLAARCAAEDGDLADVEREGERLYRMLSAAAGTEEHIDPSKKGSVQ